MRRSMLAYVLICTAATAVQPARAAGPKPCEELKREIAAKIDARGVTHYTLEIVVPAATGEARVVGSCGGGSQRIVYQRLSSAADDAPAEVARVD